MVQLLEEDLQTMEVLEWTGLHVFHYQNSSASQKLRIYLNLKKLNWQSHETSIPANEHFTPYYLGINPRGLLPSIVDDGAVHIESNDIILYLEQKHPEIPLVIKGTKDELMRMLDEENDLHLAIRSLSFRFFFDPSHPTKTIDDLNRYADTGAGTVCGARDADKDREYNFWKNFVQHRITDEQTKASFQRIRQTLIGVDSRLEKDAYILGDTLSIIDIAWIVYVHRLSIAGYPFEQLHPHVAEWHRQLMVNPIIAKEITPPEDVQHMNAELHARLKDKRQTMVDVCSPELAVWARTPNGEKTATA